MKIEYSAGVIPFIIKNNEIYVLLIKQVNDVICFPKGHLEKDETAIDAAIRETFEETNAIVSILKDFKEEINYYMTEYDSYKNVVYFLGKITNETFIKQDIEVKDIMLVNINEAFELLQYDNLKELLKKAKSYLINNSNMI